MQSTLKIGGKKILVTHPAGTELTMEGGKLSATIPSHRSLEAQLTEAMGQEGIQWGDAIAWATSKLGIDACAACKARQQILNHVKSLGMKETLLQIKETFRGSR